MKPYLAILDQSILDNTLFLTSFAKALGAHGLRKGIVLHADSSYTERLIQTGMMRIDAKKRAVRDLNRRLIGLLADEGVSAIGLHGSQKELIQLTNGELALDKNQLFSLPKEPVILLSNLVSDSASSSKLIPLHKLSCFLAESLDHELVIFSNENNELSDTTGKLASEFDKMHLSYTKTGLSDFKNWPGTQNNSPGT